MNAAPFSRLLWKEYRQQRAFWLAAMLIIAMILCLSGMVVSLTQDNPRDFSYLLIGEILSVFYALGCGAMLFAGEHENGTYEFQRNLPLTGSKVFWAKAVFALLSTAAFACALAIPAFLADRYFGYRLSDPTLWRYWWFAYACMLSLALLWGMLFSLLINRVLVATFLGGAVGIVVSIGGRAILANAFLQKDSVLAIVFFFADFVALILANIWLGRRWFQNRVAGGGRFAARWGLGESARDAAGSENMARTNKKIILGRLVWQQWRFSRLLMGVYALAFAALFVLLTTSIFRTYHPDHLHEFFYPAMRGYSLFLACCLISLFGASVFHGDQQRHSVRFLAERAADPRHVWLSRQAVWFAPPLLIFLVYYIYLAIASTIGAYGIVSCLPEKVTWTQTAWWAVDCLWHEIILRPAGWLAIIALIFAAGQLCSMLFRSALLAAVFGLGLGKLCAGWAAFMTWLGASPLWSSLPIAAGMLAATWLLVPNWMRERTGCRQYLRPTAAVLAPLAAVVIIIPFYRVYSIPGGGPGFDVAEYTRPATTEEQATLEMYRQACKLMKPDPKGNPGASETYYDLLNTWNLDVSKSERETASRKKIQTKAENWLNPNEKAIELAMAASRRKSCGIIEITNDRFPSTAVLAYMLIIDGHRLSGQGKLDEAAERYLGSLRIASHLGRGMGYVAAAKMENRAYEGLRNWSAMPGQTADRIKGVIKELDAIAKTRPSADEAVKACHMSMRSIIADDDKLLELALSDFGGNWLLAHWYTLPWERARLLRLLDQAANNDLESYKNKSNADFSYAYDQTASHFKESPPSLVEYRIYKPRSFLYGTARISTIIYDIFFHEFNIQIDRQATEIILAFEAWKLEHGELPKSLDELVGPYLEELPTPWLAGTEYAYFPNGLPKPLWAYPSEAGNYTPFERREFRPRTPLLLACDGMYRESGGREIEAKDEMEIPKRYRLNPEDILVNDGFAFPIP